MCKRGINKGPKLGEKLSKDWNKKCSILYRLKIILTHLSNFVNSVDKIRELIHIKSNSGITIEIKWNLSQCFR